ncbi:MAG TPA: ABC transporter permease [Thermoanaerobaculia bacterium]|nr:ABC transporter permease [Thermoanaerobaculia bacterium]
MIGEVALSLVLLIGAGLLARTLLRLSEVRPGFDPARRLSFSLELPAAQYPSELRAVTATRLRDALAALPGVEAVALGSDLPLRGSTSAGFLFLSGGATPTGVRFYRHRVLPGYFAALQVPIARGRAFAAADRRGAPPVAIVSRAMARRFWGEARAVGQRLSLDGPEGPWVEVVGIAGDVRYRDLTTDLGAAASEPDVYLPFAQEPDDDLEVALRTAGDPAAIAPLARAAVAAVDPELPVFQVETLQEVLAGETALQRLGTLLLGAFAAVALALAAIGIYGVIAYGVGLGRREIALRMALGGRASSVVGLVVRQGMLLVAVGVVVGIATSAVASRALSRLLFGVAATDLLTFTLVSLLLLATAFTASLLPACRAARLEPQAVLRGD